MTPDKFPINSAEIAFIANLATVLLYVTISLATCRRPFNMDRLLHRGEYSGQPVQAVLPERRKMTVGRFWNEKILGFDANYTRGDKALAWSVFLYSFGYGFVLCFVVVVIWDWISPWPLSWWGHYFWFKNIFVALVIAAVSTVWFGIGGTMDLYRMFRRLAAQKENELDDGRVVDNMSVADIAHFEEVERKHEGEKASGGK